MTAEVCLGHCACASDEVHERKYMRGGRWSVQVARRVAPSSTEVARRVAPSSAEVARRVAPSSTEVARRVAPSRN